jgi:hypothetical protein
LKKIYGTFEKDYDINYIHDNILKIFEYRKECKLELLEEKLKYLPKDKVKKYENKIKNIKNSSKEKEYYDKCYGYVTTYNKIKKVSKKRILKPNEEEYRLNIIMKYIASAGKYIKLNITCTNDNKNLCENCKYDFTHYEKDDVISLCICPQCGLEKECLKKCSYNTENIREVKNHNYEDRENFIEALHRDQGLTHKWPPPEVYTLFDDYCVKCDYLTKEDVEGLPLDEYGRKPGTDKQIIFSFLKKFKLSDYNGDANIIGHVHWGWTLPDYSKYMEELIDDYDKLQVIYEEVKSLFGKKRKSSLNIEFRRFKHLQLVGYPCQADDFKIIMTRDILEKYEKIWKLIIDEAQIRYPSKSSHFVYHSLL